MYQKTIKDISEDWKLAKKEYIKLSTYAAYVLLINNHIIPHFGNLTKIEENDVQNFVLQSLNKGLKEKTIKDIIIVLKMIVKFGIKNKYLEYQQIDVVFPTNHEEHKMEVLSRQDEKEIMDYLEQNFTFKNLGIIICLSTGIRIGEICALKWEDIDIENGFIKVSKTLQRIYLVDKEIKTTKLIIDKPKTRNSFREIPLSSDLVKIVKPIMKVVNKNYYILTNEEKPTEPRTYRNYYKNLMRKLNIPLIKFHGLRHSFATRCIESNCDYKTISVLLGHSNITTTLNLYVHPNFEQKKKAINKMLRSIK